MPDPRSISELEQLVLLSISRLGADSYGVTVHREIEERAGVAVSIAAVYSALDRLERRGYAESWLSEPTAQRGGRARKHFRITSDGSRAVLDARRRLERMWDGLAFDPEPGTRR